MPEGLIYKSLSGFYYVNVEDETLRCTARGRFRHDMNSPLVGDRVVFTETEDGKGIITDILPRRNVFQRPPLANIDKLIIVSSKATPSTDPYLIDRLTVIAQNCDCKPVICINKLDIDEADELCGIYATTGYTVIKTSALKRDGIDELIAEIKGSICAFCGNSGVGKSSILNAIEPDFNIMTGDVSRKLGRGRHTTRHVELYSLRCGALIADTPGFSSFDIGFIAAKEKIQYLFPEFGKFIGKCRFDDCAHINEPGCAVLEGLSDGTVHISRHESYKRIYQQAAEYKSWEHAKL